MKYILLLAQILLLACSGGDHESLGGRYAAGTFFIFGSSQRGEGSGTISFADSQGNYEEEIYRRANGIYLGDVLNDMHINDGKAYFLLRNNGLVVADAGTMKYQKTVPVRPATNFHPKHLMVIGDKAFVSYTDALYGAGVSGIRAVDLATGKMSADIDGTTGATPVDGASNMRMEYQGQILCAACARHLVVIEPGTAKVIRRVDFDHLIKGVTVGNDGNIWVALAGVPSSIVGIRMDDYSVFRTNLLPDDINFAESNAQPHIGLCGSTSEPILFFWHRTSGGMKVFRHDYESGITSILVSLSDYGDLRGGLVNSYIGVHPETGILYLPVILDYHKVIIATFDSRTGYRMKYTYHSDHDNCYGVEFKNSSGV